MARPAKIKETEIEKAEKSFDSFNESVKELTMDRMAQAPKHEVEEQTKLSQKEIRKSNETYLKPLRSISGADKFNEKYRADWEFQKEFVNFIAENRELKGSAIEIWTRPFGGVPAEYWEVPVNKPVWGPRYLAEQITRCQYHRLRMEDAAIKEQFGFAQMNGVMVADTTEQRLDAIPVSKNKSLFMGSNSF